MTGLLGYREWGLSGCQWKGVGEIWEWTRELGIHLTSLRLFCLVSCLEQLRLGPFVGVLLFRLRMLNWYSRLFQVIRLQVESCGGHMIKGLQEKAGLLTLTISFASDIWLSGTSFYARTGLLACYLRLEALFTTLMFSNNTRPTSISPFAFQWL